MTKPLESDRERLVRLRDRLDREIDKAIDTGKGAVAQLSAQLRATIVDIAVLDAVADPAKGAVVAKRDELRERRENRSSTSAAVAPAERAGRQRRA